MVAVITGGSRGIGAATAELLAGQGWDVAVGYRVDEDAAGAVVDRCRAMGRRAVSPGSAPRAGSGAEA